MATGDLIQEFYEEGTCSICLEYFKDPVIIDCGHNFCQTCITQCWEESDQPVSCPQCREAFEHKNFRPNRQLANLLGIVKKHQAEKRTAGKARVCEKHQEPLKLFCKDDQAFICVVCDRSKEHRKHNVLPIEEASQEHKEKIQAQLPSLEKERKTLTAQKLAEEQTSEASLTKLRLEKQKITTAFEQMQKFLEEEKCLYLAQLEDLEEVMEKQRKENGTQLSEEIACLSRLITDLGVKCQQPANEFLQDVKDTLSRSMTVQVRQQPLQRSPELDARLRNYTQINSALKEVFKKCEESLEQIQQKVSSEVSVTLDPRTAQPNLHLSHDLKQVKIGGRQYFLRDNPERFDSVLCVLGCEKFISGRHWWVVELEGSSAEWAVGVARESVRRKGGFSLIPNEWVWAVQKQVHYSPGGPVSWVLSASTSPCPTVLYSGSDPAILSLGSELRKIQVSLDYIKDSVSFSDADTGQLIFTFSPASFRGDVIRPFFWLCRGTSLRCW